MTSFDAATAKVLARQTYKKAVRETDGEAGLGYGDLWNRAEWERVKRETALRDGNAGSYPFGLQADGSVIRPPTYAGCPDWAYELMRERKPPVETIVPR